jgi:hypothetical protein
MAHKVYSAIVTAVKSGTLLEPFSKDGVPTIASSDQFRDVELIGHFTSLHVHAYAQTNCPHLYQTAFGAPIQCPHSTKAEKTADVYRL